MSEETVVKVRPEGKDAAKSAVDLIAALPLKRKEGATPAVPALEQPVTLAGLAITEQPVKQTLIAGLGAGIYARSDDEAVAGRRLRTAGAKRSVTSGPER